MYICVCRGISDKQIEAAAQQGITSLEELSESMGVGADCGVCQGHACQVLERSPDKK
ncbi:bacterioferritin-associated ferredoxin [Synechocystis salina LEGE 06099]|uniref:bacterioferritin-associated ferredoxin n=1 Tax=Synechocystis salina TaxID=945780 RepID=UPI001881A8D5|nr:bacterioferritin-associated ferredoxin [Synechocystis salina]MBE9202829.1 bacterioferritin-associated ferredoxin [Synechocystis salina LEGE 06099]